MDVSLLIIILLVVYVVPEIVKRLKPKKPYHYPEFPSTLPQGQESSDIPGGFSRGVKPPPVPSMTGEGTAGDEGDPLWGLHAGPEILAIQETGSFIEGPEQGFRLRTTDAAMGIIWAEIIAKPVALRSINRGSRRF